RPHRTSGHRMASVRFAGGYARLPRLQRRGLSHTEGTGDGVGDGAARPGRARHRGALSEHGPHGERGRDGPPSSARGRTLRLTWISVYDAPDALAQHDDTITTETRRGSPWTDQTGSASARRGERHRLIHRRQRTRRGRSAFGDRRAALYGSRSGDEGRG